MAAGATYEPIATQKLASAASSITFSSIPATYTDLRLVLVSTGSAGANVNLRFNSDTASNYSRTVVTGNGTTAASAGTTNATSINLTDRWGISATIPTMQTIDIFSYAGSTNKTILAMTSGDFNGSGSTESFVGLWRSTAAITSVILTTNTADTYAANTTATLYGIKAA